MLTKIPNGLPEIIDTFGHPDAPDFEAENIVTLQLPYPLRYAGQLVYHARCHKLAEDNFFHALSAISSLGTVDRFFPDYGGIYAVRDKRGMQGHPSTHSWGIAIDLEPELYPLGSTKRFPDWVVEAFAKCGFVYGGDFAHRLDPMHFQLAAGY